MPSGENHFHISLHSLDRQKLCVEAPCLSPEELGEDEGKTGAAEEGGRAREGQ